VNPGLLWVKETSMVLGDAINGTGAHDVWVVDGAGNIWHSEGDGTWTSRTAESGWRLTGVWGSGPNDVYVSVRANFVFHWNGAGWAKQTKGIAIGLTFETIWGSGPTAVYMADPSIYHSGGDGQWQGLDVPLGSGPYVGIWGSGANDVWALGSGGVARWNGRTWKNESTGEMTGAAAIWGSGPNDVYAVYGDHIRHTDGGGSWTVQPSPPFKSALEQMISIWGSGPDDIYIGGTEGRIFHSRGDGQWIPQVVDPRVPGVSIYGIWGTGPQNIYLLAATGIFRAQPSTSPDGGG
jgi:hypothetical protein